MVYPYVFLEESLKRFLEKTSRPISKTIMEKSLAECLKEFPESFCERNFQRFSEPNRLENIQKCPLKTFFLKNLRKKIVNKE